MSFVVTELKQAMAQARDYQTWFEAAQELDRWEGMETWREDEVSPDYDYELIRDRLQTLRKYRNRDEVLKLVHYLRQGMHWNLGNISNPELYHHSRVGTKYLVQDYLDTLASTLNYLCDTDFPELPTEEKNKFFQDVALSFGRSALVLSGGATMGFFHIGVIKALREQGLLPRVISGSSAGAMVAAGLGTVKDDELDKVFDPRRFSVKFWELLRMSAAMRRGVIMDDNQLRAAIESIIPDMTFAEAYEHTRCIVNITVSPAHTNQIPRLLNYLTFPHLYIREAVLASCAVPFVFPPQMLMTRDDDGKKVPFMPTQKWVDGSMKSDLPILRLRRLHNVNHTIVSQTNPLVLPFMQLKGSEQDTFLYEPRNFLLSNVRSQLQYAAKVGGRYAPIAPIRQRLSDAHALLEQDYRGNVTILPRFKLINYLRLAANPSVAEVEDYILEGERSTWPKLAMIRNQTMISQTLDGCLDRIAVRAAAAAGKPQPEESPRKPKRRLQLRLVR
jgi:TAG lipase / steryl ester hydrolase / phospholipase A2 / LPA acyltransferase